MKKLNQWVLAFALVFISLPALADGEWVFTDPPLVSAADGSLARNPSASIRGDWRQPRTLQGVNTSLHDRLPGMGSREEMLDYIVSSNNMSMNMYVSLVVETPRYALSTGRWSYGFASYEDCLRDLAIGMERTYNKFKTNNLDPSALVYATIYVTYFNEDGTTESQRGNGLALSIYNAVDRFDSISLEKIMGALEMSDPISYAQVIVRVPRLDSINVKVEVSTGAIAELNWTANTGAQPSSLWRQYSVREWTTPTYLYLREWYCDGSKPARVTLRSFAGQDATYTQFGDNLANIGLQMSHDALHIIRPRGAEVDILQSADLQSWNQFRTVTVGSDPTTIPLAQPPGKMLFFRGGEAF